MTHLKIAIILTLCILCVCSTKPMSFADESGSKEGYQLLFQANQSYKKGAYGEAASMYEQLIMRQPVGGGVFYNLGNCYVRLDNLGRAILNYERARRFMPRNPDLDFNLRYVRDRIKDRIEMQESFSWFQWLDDFSGSEVFWSFVVINLFFWVTLVLRLWIWSEWGLYLLIGFGLLWVILGAFGSIKWYKETHDKRGVVVTQEINVRSGPDTGDTILFKLHAGTIVICEREEFDWRLIRITSEKRGWTQSEFVEPVAFTHTFPSHPPSHQETEEGHP